MPPTASFWMPPGRQLTAVMPLFALLGGRGSRLANNIIVTGTNQENAAYPSGLCAERTTLFYANSQYPDQAVETLAIAARNERGEFLEEPIPRAAPAGR